MRWIVSLTLLMALGCGDAKMPGDPVVDSQTHWMEACTTSEECGDLVCSCGVCTVPCDDAEACSALGPAVCGDVCSESAAVCLPTCGVFGDCAEYGDHLTCVEGRCLPGDPGNDPDAGLDVPDLPDADGGDDDASPDEPCTLEPVFEPLVDEPGVSGLPRVAAGTNAVAWVDRSLGRPQLAVARGDESWRGPQPVGGVGDVAIAVQGDAIALAWVDNGTRVFWDRLDSASGTWNGPVELMAVEDGQIADALLRADAGGWSVAWTWEREVCCPATLESSVFLRAVADDGGLAADPVELVAGAEMARQPAWVAVDSGFALVWVAAATSEVRAATYASEGTRVGEVSTVSGEGAVPIEPSIAARGEELVVAWGDRRVDLDKPEIFLARVGEPERQVTIDGKDSRWPQLLAVDEGYALLWMDQLPVRVPSGVSSVTVAADLTTTPFVQVASMEAAGGGLSATWDGGVVNIAFHSVGPAGQGGAALHPRALATSPAGEILVAEMPLAGPVATVSAVSIAVGATVRGAAWIDARSGGADVLFATWGDDGQLLPEVLLTAPGASATAVDLAAGGDSFGVVYTDAGGIWLQVSGVAGPAAPPLELRPRGAGLLQAPRIAATETRFGVVWAEGEGAGSVEFREVSLGGQPLDEASAAYGDSGGRIAIVGEQDGFAVAWTHRLASQLWQPGGEPAAFAHALDAVPAAGGVLLIDEERVTAEIPSGSVSLDVALGDWVAVEAADGWNLFGTQAAVRVSAEGEITLLGTWPPQSAVEDVAGGSVARGLDASVEGGPFEIVCP